MLPGLPPWAGMHPLLVHFPIALLFTVPVFLALALALGRRHPAWNLAALVLVLLGTAGLFMAAASGEAAGKVADRTPEINAVLDRHEHLAETARGLFSGLAMAFAAVVLVPLAWKRAMPAWGHALAYGTSILAFLGGLGFLAQVAHQGGRLVHQYGVHTLLPPDAAGAAPQAAASPADDD